MPIYKKVNKNFFKKWTPKMAYILGFFAADGNMIRNKRGGCFVALHSKDKNILVAMKKIMNSDHKIAKRNFKGGFMYRIQIGSKEMFNDLASLGFVPRKTDRIVVPNVPRRFLGGFVRGYFDGDGNVWSGFINTNRKIPTTVLQVAFTGGSRLFLKNMLRLLRRNGISGGSIYGIKNKKCWRIMFSTKDALKLYKIMYNSSDKLYLKRKKLVFDNFIKIYKNAAVV